MGWSSYPPEHKRSFFRAVTLYAAMMAAVSVWVWLRSDAALEDWKARVPHAAADIRTIYVTPETAQVKPFTGDNTLPPPGAGEGYISIIMTDIGISNHATERALDDLPPPVVLAFSPYARQLDRWLKKAADAKRESLILLPMEPSSYPKDDPGPDALLSRLSDKENTARLERVLEKSDGAMGTMNFMGSGFLADDRNTRPVFDALRSRHSNMLFVEAPTHAGAGSAAETAKAAGIPYLAADMHIDVNATELAIKKQLLDLENIAHKRGYAVAIAQPYPVTFNILKDWAESLDRRGIKLVPLTAVLKTKVQHDKAAPQQEQTQPQQ
jgi:uncharacterized protein